MRRDRCFVPGIPAKGERPEADAVVCNYASLTPYQTGGLLLAVPAEKRDAFETALNSREQASWEIGRLVEGKPAIALKP